MFFHGASGPVGFADDGDRLGVFNIQQFNISGFTQTVGFYQSYDEKFIWDAPHKLVWANGAPPHDEIKTEEKLLTMSPGILGVVFCLSVMGILLAIGLLVFNIVKRNERTIKMSSPNINNLIIVGGIVSYVAAIMSGVDRSLVGENAMDHVCRARLWLLALGFTLSFGSMFSKTFRVHRIFLNKKMEKRVVKDYQLLGMAMSFVALETIYLLIWEVMYPLHAVTETFLSQATIKDDLMIVPSIESCYRAEFRSISWLVGIYVFNGVLLLFGLFLAYETRHVHIKALNDSKNIGVSVYNVTILSIVGAIFSLLMDPLHSQLVYIITAMCIILSTTSTLVIIFAPKVKHCTGVGTHRFYHGDGHTPTGTH
ncbi:gamma-aminobutyric acid type B receptor subunit 2-like isoform X2 [Amphiura filiformis]|uniref:gamma-aminobutyric acid type B receptor subunit 2-like isoform X2 n=1 Tax=Amphiura filiformis TaxID=82378 RepID=UPI003B2219FD